MAGDEAGERCRGDLRIVCWALVATVIALGGCGGGSPAKVKGGPTGIAKQNAAANLEAARIVAEVKDLSRAYRYAIADDRQDDDRIRTYGHEMGEPDRRAVVALIDRYYAAAAADDGARACALMYPVLAKAVPEDYGKGRPSLRGNTCASVMSKIFRQLPGQPMANLATTRVIGVRVEGDEGYVQWTSRLIPTGVIAIRRYGRDWRVYSTIGAGCRKCYAGRIRS